MKLAIPILAAVLGLFALLVGAAPTMLGFSIWRFGDARSVATEANFGRLLAVQS